MLLRHATLRRNLASIRRAGLLTAKSQGRLPAVWLHAPSKTPWSMLHVVKRHGGRVQDVVIIEVEVPDGWLRHRHRGVWYTPLDLSPARFRRLIAFGEVAGASLDQNRRAVALAS